MPELKVKRNFYRTRTAYSLTRTVPPTITKRLIDMQTDGEETPNFRKSKTSWKYIAIRAVATALDRIISKLQKDHKAEDILLIITPASRHANRYKLHVIQRHNQCHLGMITITHEELSFLKASKAFHKYCIVFASHYINLYRTEPIKSLMNCLNKKCCSESKETVKYNSNSAGDYFNEESIKSVKLQDSFIQTDSENQNNKGFSLKDIYTLLESINQTLQPCKNDIERFFFMADKLNFSLVVRPELLWKACARVDDKTQGHFLLESYLPGNCYLGCITLLETDLLQGLDSYPKLLFNIHVIEDVFEITPLPKMFINILKSTLGFLKLELLYDAVGELLFDWYKNITFL